MRRKTLVPQPCKSKFDTLVMRNLDLIAYVLLLRKSEKQRRSTKLMKKIAPAIIARVRPSGDDLFERR